MAVLPHEGTYSVMYGACPIPIGTGYRRGYISRPDKAGRFPTVIMLPDMGGVTSHEKYVSRRMARRGVAVVAVELYAAKPQDDDEALALYNALGDAEALRTIDETHQFLASEDIDWAHHSRMGVMGIDTGGRFALTAAAHRQWVAAAAVAYAPLSGDEDRKFPVADMLGHLPVPVLGLYGTDDELIAAESVDEAQERNAGGSWLLYEGAGHGFLDEVGPNFNPAAAEDAFVRLTDFFKTHLPAADEPDLG